jgi:streptogramin lyase
MRARVGFGFVGVMALMFALLLAFSACADAVTITDFEIEPGAPAGTVLPRYIEAGPDGNLWFTVVGTFPGIYHVTPSGERFKRIEDANGPYDLAWGSSGTLYWTSDNGIGRRLPSGSVGTALYDGGGEGLALTASGLLAVGAINLNDKLSGLTVCVQSYEVFAEEKCGSRGREGISPSGRVTGVALAPDTTLWAAFLTGNVVRHFDAAGNEIGKVELPLNSSPARVAITTDGRVWVTMATSSEVDPISAAGVRETPVHLPPGSEPNDIAVGPDGALWVTEFASNKIARITTAGVLTGEYELPTVNSGPSGITTGPDGALWITEQKAGKIARLLPDPAGPGGGGGGGTGTGGGSAGSGSTATKGAPPRFTRSPIFAPARFAVAGGHGKGVSGPSGSKLDLSLSEAATVTATISRSQPGRRKGRRCVAPGAAPKGAAGCKRFVAVGKVSWSGEAGADKLPFSGKVGGKALTPGAYRAAVVAKDAAGTSAATNVAFTIVG